MQARSIAWGVCFAGFVSLHCGGGSDSRPTLPDGTALPEEAAPGDDTSEPGDGAVPVDGCDGAGARDVNVADAAALEAALVAAQPGDLIRLADGSYPGNFVAAASGTAASPILLCGSRQAVLQGSTLASGYGLHLRASYWVLSGFRVTGSQKGIVVEGGSHNLLTDLEVDHVGQEAIHFRRASSDNMLSASSIHDTGTGPGSRDKGFGEGVYLGSAESNWDTYGDNGGPDRSDRNQVIGNTIGPNTSAECLDIKEGTTGGVIRDNQFDGTGMTGDNFADSWVDVKGNGYRLEGNRGTHALLDGFQTHVQVTGWGNDNTFVANTMSDVPGYGINVVRASTGTVVTCDNTVTAGGTGLSNIACQ